MQQSLLGGPIDLSPLLEAIREQGWFVSDQLLSPTWAAGTMDEVLAIQAQRLFSSAGIGRGDDHLVHSGVRTGENYWLPATGNPPHLTAYMAFLEQLRGMLNRELLLGLWQTEVNLAHYPPGAFYKRHRDAFRGQTNRRISTITYLQSGWHETDGGLLKLWLPDGDTRTFAPHPGRFLCFLSERFPHEVQVSYRTRYSLSGWLRVRSTEPLFTPIKR